MTYNIRKDLKKTLGSRGLCNNHLHIDRAYSLTKEELSVASKDLKEKWSLVDKYKSTVSENEMLDKMLKVVNNQKRQGVAYLHTFLDCDEIIKDKALNAFDKLKLGTANTGVELRCSNQTLKGVLDREALYWFDLATERTDYIGSLLAKDACREDEHLDTLFKRADLLGKKVYIHVDQFREYEKETELVIQKVRQHDMQGEVNIIHALSVNCFNRGYRHRIYKGLEDNDIGVITCPTSWIDQERSEMLVLKSNPSTPIDEMLEYKIRIGIGTDNISDLMLPFSDGNMVDEAILMARMNRICNLDSIANILVNKI